MTNSKKGFTLIEVVIVLAIAALIMVIVFLAVAGAQRARRDTVTKDAAARVIAAMEQYAGNNSGTYAVAALPAGYTTNIKASNGGAPAYGATTATAAAPLYYASGYICNGGAMTTTGANARNVAASYWSENANAAACLDNH